MGLEAGLKEQYESRLSQLQEQLNQTPGIKKYFFLMYELPNGQSREAMGTDRTRLISEMYLKLLQICETYAEIRYLCRCIGKPHDEDNEEPEIFINKPFEDWVKETKEVMDYIRNFS